MNQTRNEAYWELKERLDKWGTSVTLVIPLALFFSLGAGGAILGDMFFSPHGFLIGLLIGAIISQAIGLTFWKRKLGFIIHSKEGCQSCKLPLAEYRLRRMRLAKICRDCGNDNRLELHDN